MEHLKESIANGIVKALEQDFLNNKYSLELATTNCFKDLKSDTINTLLDNEFTSDGCFVHKFKRRCWQGMVLIDLNSKALVSITSTMNLKRVSKDKSRKVPHYMQSIINSLNKHIQSHNQLSFSFFNTFDEETYDRDFNNIFSKIDIDLKDFTYYVVAYDYKFNKVTGINWYLLGSDFYIEEKESLMKYIKPDILELTNLENETDDTDTNSEYFEPNEGIKLGLKKKKSKKNS